jgi:hypothetical protein
MIKWGDFTKYQDLDCWIKYYLDSALKQSFNTYLKIKYGYFTINKVRRLY